MDPTLLLSKIFGGFFIIMAFVVFTKRKHLMLAVEAMFQERFAQLLAGMITTLGGLFFVSLYRDYSSLPAGIISIIAWLLLAKGLLYLFFPHVILSKFTRGILNQKSWYIMDGILALLFGLYLAGFGFGVW